MQRALELAHEAAAVGEVPVGAVVIDAAGTVIAEARNTREGDNDPCGHAELTAIRKAAQALGHWRLTGCTVYVTLEPCAMCAGALVNARVSRLVFGAHDPKAGATGSLADVCRDPRLNHRLVVDSGVLKQPCGDVLRLFFRAKR